MLAKRRQAARAVFGAIFHEWKDNYSSTTHTPGPRRLGPGVFVQEKVTPPGQAARAVFGAICDEWKENYSSTTHTPEPRGLGLGINVQKVSPPAGRRFRLAVEGSWFQTLEAQMEAIKKQVLSRKSSLLSCAIIPRSF